MNAGARKQSAAAPVTREADVVAAAPKAEQADFQPLYAQVKTLLLKRIASGAWKPGEVLPSEFELASSYKVSQGTVRKALMALEADRLIVRRQGRGTFVARHTSQETLFHFFRMVGADGTRLEPSSVVLSQRTVSAKAEQASIFSVEAGAALHAIVRVRQFGGIPAIFERVFVLAASMPGLSLKLGSVMTEELYVIYEETFGISVARASERLTAVAATAEEARHLHLPPGTPMLQVRRLAHDVGGACVELRISRCNTQLGQYAAEVY